MTGVEIVLMLVVAQYQVMSFLTGRARLKFGVAAPATTGHPIFERYYRMHQNTLEQLMIFIPGLMLFGLYVSPRAAIVLGSLFFVARLVYAVGYVKNPERRYYGAAPTVLINFTLIVGSLLGMVRAL